MKLFANIRITRGTTKSESKFNYSCHAEYPVGLSAEEEKRLLSKQKKQHTGVSTAVCCILNFSALLFKFQRRDSIMSQNVDYS